MTGKKRILISYIVLLLLLLVLFAAGILCGSVDILTMLSEKGTIEVDSTEWMILLLIRLPRVCAAMLLGGALALAGYLLQTFFHNPIAGPFVLGISSGAKLMVAFVMVWCLANGVANQSLWMILAAMLGSLLAVSLVLLFSKWVHGMSHLVVGGIMIGYICTAVTDFVVTFAEDSNIVNLHNWSKGSFSGMTWGNLAWIAPLVLVTFLLVLLQSKPMSAYQLGEEYAASLGVSVRHFRVLLIVFSSLLAATVTAFAGPISFVGIAVPHLVKLLFRCGKPLVLIPACFLGGAVFCLFCDLLARTVFAPTELSISTVTAVFGAPVVLYLLTSRKKEAQR